MDCAQAMAKLTKDLESDDAINDFIHDILDRVRPIKSFYDREGMTKMFEAIDTTLNLCDGVELHLEVYNLACSKLTRGMQFAFLREFKYETCPTLENLSDYLKGEIKVIDRQRYMTVHQADSSNKSRLVYKQRKSTS